MRKAEVGNPYPAGPAGVGHNPDKRDDKCGCAWAHSSEGDVFHGKNRGLSVCGYVEELWEQNGRTAAAIERMGSYGVFDEPPPVKCRNWIRNRTLP